MPILPLGGSLLHADSYFGDDPVIRPDTEPHFSAWEYAKVRCADICLEPFDSNEQA